MQGGRLGRALNAILDATGLRPFVTEVGCDMVEIATNYYGEGVRTLRIPRRAVLAGTLPAPRQAPMQ